MRKLFIALLMLVSVNVFADDNLILQGNNIVSVKSDTIKTPDMKTKFTWEIKDIKYPVYMSKRGSFYVIRTSKKGKQYKSYLPKDMSAKLREIIK